MQPYSELANWDGSLEDLVVDPLGPPSPSDTPSLPMYDQYHHNQSVDQQVCRSSSLTLLFLPSLNPALIQTTRCKKKKKFFRQESRIYYPQPPHHHRQHQYHYRISDHPPLVQLLSSQAPPPSLHKNARLWPISHSIPMIPMILNPRALPPLQAQAQAQP